MRSNTPTVRCTIWQKRQSTKRQIILKGDVQNEYDAGEYVAAAHGAIHDLGILRTDLPETLIDGIEGLIKQIKAENDSFNVRFLRQMEEGLLQSNERRALINGRKMA
jgi:hypothetical protein